MKTWELCIVGCFTTSLFCGIVFAVIKWGIPWAVHVIRAAT